MALRALTKFAVLRGFGCVEFNRDPGPYFYGGPRGPHFCQCQLISIFDSRARGWITYVAVKRK